MSRNLSGDIQISNGELGLSQCVWCRHRLADGQRCRAYPDGIPESIIRNRHDHRKPFSGDSGILFEPEEVEIEFLDDDQGDDPVPLRVDVDLAMAGIATGDNVGRGGELPDLDDLDYVVRPDDLD